MGVPLNLRLLILGGNFITGGVGVGGLRAGMGLQKAAGCLLSLVMHPVLRSFDEIISKPPFFFSHRPRFIPILKCMCIHYLTSSIDEEVLLIRHASIAVCQLIQQPPLFTSTLVSRGLLIIMCNMAK